MNNRTIGNIISKIVDKTWNVIENGIQSLLSLFQKRELAPDQPIIPAKFVLEESESDVMEYGRQYTIRSPPIFMVDVRELITNKLGIIREIKVPVMMVLRCYMQRTNIAAGEKKIKEETFCSDHVIIDDDSDVDYIYDKMVDEIEERLVAFKWEISDWAFSLIASLEIHTYEMPAPFDLEESESDLWGFNRRYTIRGRPLYDPITFIYGVRDTVTELITNRLEITRQTKVKMMLNFMMKRKNITTGEKTIEEEQVCSDLEKILDASDANYVDYIYVKMIDRIDERLDYWALSSIGILEIHTGIEERL